MYTLSDLSQVPELAVVDLEEMTAAAALIEAEAKVVREGMGHSMTGAEEYAQVWDTCFQDVLWLPSLQSYGRTANATNSDRLDSVKGEFEAARAEMEKDAKKAAKLEQKVNMLTAGYASRAAQSGVELGQVFEQAAEAKIEVECFKALQRQASVCTLHEGSPTQAHRWHASFRLNRRELCSSQRCTQSHCSPVPNTTPTYRFMIGAGHSATDKELTVWRPFYSP
jgi:hypothetical protein